MKAFVVTEDNENTGGVIFAEHAIVARRRGADEYNDGSLGGMSCRRAPWADQYYPGPVPKLVMIDRGWWFECDGCLTRIDSDGEDDDGEGEVRKLSPIEVGGSLYCCAECRERTLAEKALKARLQDEAIADLRGKLLAIMPGVELVCDDGEAGRCKPHAYVAKQNDGTYAAQQCIIWFRFPGCKIGPAGFRFDKVGEEPHVSVCSGDLDAWSAWRGLAS